MYDCARARPLFVAELSTVPQFIVAAPRVSGIAHYARAPPPCSLAGGTPRSRNARHCNRGKRF
eukprot:1256073-Lingulodinium_polyedra.AAC.1